MSLYFTVLRLEIICVNGFELWPYCWEIAQRKQKFLKNTFFSWISRVDLTLKKCRSSPTLSHLILVVTWMKGNIIFQPLDPSSSDKPTYFIAAICLTLLFLLSISLESGFSLVTTSHTFPRRENHEFWNWEPARAKNLEQHSRQKCNFCWKHKKLVKFYFYIW